MNRPVVECRIALLVSHLLLFSVVLAARRPPASSSLSYQLVEEQPPGTVVADMRRDSGLVADSNSSRTNTTFSLLVASAHFRVAVDSGVISTVAVVDRDVLCPGQSQCQLSVNVVVRPDMHFIKVHQSINECHIISSRDGHFSVTHICGS